MKDRHPDGAVETTRLVRLWEQLQPRSFVPRDGLHPANALQIWTLAHHASRLSKAVLTLHRAGQHLEAMPLIRQTLECAINCSWLLFTDDGGVALSHVDTKNRRVAFREVTDLGIADLSDVLRRLDGEEARNARDFNKTRSLEERCRAIAGGAWLYTIWRTLSLYSHASTSVADVYLRSAAEEEDQPYDVGLRWDADWDQGDAWMRVQALAMLLAEMAADEARERPFHRTQLSRAQARLGVDWRIGRAQPRQPG